MTTEKILAWYFAPEDEKLGYEDGREIKEGTTHTVDGEISLCHKGLHGSVTLMDALSFKASTVLYRVEISGSLDISEAKLCGSTRTYLKRYKVSKHTWVKFSKKIALRNIHLVEEYCKGSEYEDILAFLNSETVDAEAAGDAAGAARDARDAAEAAGDAARATRATKTAARAVGAVRAARAARAATAAGAARAAWAAGAAWDVAEAAAGAAGDAAWNAARDAAWADAADAAARAASYAAARETAWNAAWTDGDFRDARDAWAAEKQWQEDLLLSLIL